MLVALAQRLAQQDSLAARGDSLSLAELRWREILNLRALAQNSLRIVIIVALAWLAYLLLRVVLRRIERSVEDQDPSTVSIQEQRVRTLTSVIRSIGVVFITLIAVFMVLRAVGIDIGPLLAGAGVIGLAISFGAQSLVKDLISGLFILFENQFRVGDVVRIGTVSGQVEKMTLRIVVMRDVQGVVHIVPNGEITQVSNLTRSFSRAVLDVGVAYSENVDRVMAILRDLGRELWADPEWRPLLVEEVKVPGVESFGETAVNIRVQATTVPLKQWDVARELRRRIKLRFDREGVEMIPLPQITVYWGEGQSPSEKSATARESR